MEVRETFSEHLEEVRAALPREGLSRFSNSVEQAWVEQALQATGTATVRRRKVVASDAVWMVLGMCLMTDRSIAQVLSQLQLVMRGVGRIARSTATHVRYRIGSEPLRLLFEKVCRYWTHPERRYDSSYQGLRVWGMDGTTLRVQDSEENFKHFGKPGGRSGQSDAGYPQMRMVALMQLSSRMLSGARAGRYCVSEISLARELVDTITAQSLTLLDRHFDSYELFHTLHVPEQDKHVLIRIKKSRALYQVRELADGSALAEIRPNRQLKTKHPELPASLPVRVIEYQLKGHERVRLVTSLLDPARYPAQELAELYHTRWELEVGFDELKTHMLERKECLRSKKVEGVYQELWAQLLVYNLVRLEMARAAQEQGLPASRISFRTSLLLIRNVWVAAALPFAASSKLPQTLSEMRTHLALLILPPRKAKRRYPRHVKIKMSNYPRNRGKRLLDPI